MGRVPLLWLLIASLLFVRCCAFGVTPAGGPASVTHPAPPVTAPAHPPQLTVVPGSTVFVATGDGTCDLFHYGGSWYAFDNGSWYRARTYRGPFAAVNVRVVPSAVVNVPARFWHEAHRAAPAQARGRDDDLAGNETPGRAR